MKPALTAQPAIADFEALLSELEQEISEELLTKLVAIHRRNIAFFKVMEEVNTFLVQKIIEHEVSNELLA
jgi:hypothetical protein